MLLPPRTSGEKRKARQPKQGRHAKKVGKYEASEPLEQVEPHKQLNYEELPEPSRLDGVTNRARSGILGQDQEYKPYNQQDQSYKSHNQRDSFNTSNLSKNPFTPLNRNDAMTPPHALTTSSLSEITQNEQKQREQSIDNLPFAMLSKSKPIQPDEPVYVVNLIEKRNT